MTFRQSWLVAGVVVFVAVAPALGQSRYKTMKPVTKEYKGIHRRGAASAETERGRLLEAAQQLRDRSDNLGSRADVLDDQGKDDAADDMRDRADQAAQQAKRLEDKADQLRLPSAIKRGAPRHSIESDSSDD